MRLDPGATFGRYKVEALLGEGGMGSVYRAVDTRLERPVALKLLRPDRAAGTHDRERGADKLLREARAAATIAHANAVAIYDVGEVDGTPYIAMELVVGRSLRACVGDATVSVEARVGWLTETARALSAAHARGIVHRDVKPENVMLREDGVIKVLDFGIAALHGREEPTASTSWAPADFDEWFLSHSRDGVLVGTPRYMAPEQLHGSPLDGRADQFSWGVMAYELLSGAPPWLGDTVSYGALLDQLQKEPAPLTEAAPEVSPAIASVVHRALRKPVEERFATMDALLAALAATRDRPRSAARQWALVGGVAVLSALGAAWLRGTFVGAPSSAAPTVTQAPPSSVANVIASSTVPAAPTSPTPTQAPSPSAAMSSDSRRASDDRRRPPVASPLLAPSSSVAPPRASAAPVRFRDAGF